jgi:hypothetical protein
MTIKLTYLKTGVDKVPQFGITFKEDDNYKAYIRWVYFYLGIYLGRKNSTYFLYPFDLNGRVLKEYKFCNDAERQAKLIANKIKSKLSVAAVGISSISTKKEGCYTNNFNTYYVDENGKKNIT